MVRLCILIHYCSVVTIQKISLGTNLMFLSPQMLCVPVWKLYKKVALNNLSTLQSIGPKKKDAKTALIQFKSLLSRPCHSLEESNATWIWSNVKDFGLKYFFFWNALWYLFDPLTKSLIYMRINKKLYRHPEQQNS